MKMKLKVPKVINGGVWSAGSVVDVSDYDANKLIEAGEAESASSSAPKPVSASAYSPKREAKDIEK